MINTVFNALKSLNVSVKYLIRPNLFPSITYSFTTISGQVFADDKEIETRYDLQIDIWSKTLPVIVNGKELCEGVKARLEEIEFYRELELEMFEEDTGIYHKVLRFNHLRNNES